MAKRGRDVRVLGLIADKPGAAGAHAFRKGVDQEVVGRAPRGGLKKACRLAPADVVGREVRETLRGDVPGRRIEDVGLKAHALRAAETVAVFPIDLALGSIGR